MIDIKNSHSDLHKDISIYHIDYTTIKKYSNYENTHTVNPLYLIIHSTTGYFKEKYGEK